MNAEMTTDSPLSHYGIPVLRITDCPNAGDYGPAETVGAPLVGEPGISAAAFAIQQIAFGLDEADVRAFCAQWPDGPQPQ